MIVKKEFIGKLRALGLNTYESKLWTALLSRGVSTAGELSDIAEVPRSRSYDVLESLEKKGFIVMKIGKPIKYIAVQPSEVIERVKKKIEEESETQIGVLDSVKNSKVLGELNLLHSQGVDMVNPGDLSGSLKGRNNLYNHLETVIKGAQESVVMMTTEQGLLRKRKALKSAFEKASKRGVNIKIAAPITDQTLKAVKELSKVAEVKDTKEKARFCLIDGKEVLFMLVDDEKVHPSYDSGIWVTTPLFASTIHTFFDSVWSKMKPADKFFRAS